MEATSVPFGIDREVFDWAKEMAEQEGRSIDDVIRDAIRRRRQFAARGRVLEALGQRVEPTTEELEASRAEWQG